ncbi:MAG: methyltransferase, partial [Bacteroidota bacterium]
MPNTYFQFKKFRIDQVRSGMKVTTDSCLFGAWIANHIKKHHPEPSKVLDIGTGTGLLALMMGQVTQNTRIDAIEMNEESFCEAKENFENSKWSDRLAAYHTSIQNFQPQEKYDLIICNPPFFKDNLKGAKRNKNQAIHNDSLSIDDLSKGINELLTRDGSAYVMYP